MILFMQESYFLRFTVIATVKVESSNINLCFNKILLHYYL